jgi:hypothetical protein
MQTYCQAFFCYFLKKTSMKTRRGRRRKQGEQIPENRQKRRPSNGRVVV